MYNLYALAEVTGKSLLEGDNLSLVQQAFADLQVTGTQVIGYGLVAGVALAALSGAAWMVVKWVKGAMSKAS